MTLTPPFPDRPVRFGSRGSALALAQTHLAADRFRAMHPRRAVEVHVISTEGDVDKTSPLTEIGGRGVFTSAIEAAILRGEVDAAIHSAKDLPSTLHPAVPIVAYPDRDDPRDVLISRHGVTLDLLPPHPVIGTSSRRREVQILRLRPDARIVNMRGNIDTRLRKAEGQEFDGIVLAAAGIRRMGWHDRISEYFPVERLVPSPGQGAIAIQARVGSDAAAVLETIDDASVSTAVGIERAFLAAVGAGCTYPIGAYAIKSDEGYRLIAMLADETGDRVAFASERLAAGEERVHAAEIAACLQADIATTSRARSWRGASGELAEDDLTGARVVVTRPRRQAGPLIDALVRRGAEPLPLPTIRIEPIDDLAQLDGAIEETRQGAFNWCVFTSVNAVEVFANRMDALEVHPDQLGSMRVAAVGRVTAAAVAEAGLNLTLVPEQATAEALAASLRQVMGARARVLYPRSAMGRDVLPNVLRAAGFDVLAIDVYRTLPEPNVDQRVLERLRRGEVDVITFASPSSVRHLVALLESQRISVSSIPVICAGPVTARAAREAGLLVAAVSESPDMAAMSKAIAEFWLNAGLETPRDEPAEMVAGRSAR
ncbi:MAG TPA: hydroxymethylbilane synthase [Thermomicrobiales bacterium]|nr:hydroxymethylbilane synthase [Thermomicrobiales bacterium]